MTLAAGYTNTVTTTGDRTLTNDLTLTDGTFDTAADITIGGDVTMATDASLTMTLDHATTHGKLTVTGSINVDGTLNIANSGLALDAAVTFTLFNKALTGQFDDIQLPTPAAGFAWDLDDLYSSGQVSVIAAPGGLSITPVFWLDATDIGTTVLDGSGNVARWIDKSGNNHHASQNNYRCVPDSDQRA